MDDKDIAGALLAEGSVLDKDDIPNTNQSIKCFSCSAEMTGVYCASCGQRNDDYRRSIFKLVGELIGTLTALESRIWRTWGALLFKPGKVAREFADGARVKWSTPIRAFLAISILMFGFLSITKTQLISVDLNVIPKDGITKPHEDLTNEDLRIKGAIRFFENQKKIDVRNETRNFDLIEKWLGATQIYAEVNDNIDVTLNDSPDNADTGKDVDGVSHAKLKPKSETTTDKDQEIIAAEQRVKKSGQPTVTDLLAKEKQWKQLFIRVVRNPGLVNNIIYKWLPRVMFLMMPLTMFIGVIFIRGKKNALLYDHLVHATYIHAVAFFLVFLGVLLMKIFPGNRVAQALLVVMLVYLPLSLKRMFGRGWIKTIWASYGVGLIYTLTLTAVLAVVITYQISVLANQFA